MISNPATHAEDSHFFALQCSLPGNQVNDLLCFWACYHAADQRLTVMKNRGLGFWLMQGPGWLLFLYLVYAQAIPAFDYEWGVIMGTQESASRITEVGVAFFQGFAFADLVIYIPLLGVGLAAYWRSKRWARVVLAAALGITVYWPVVCLGAVVAARDIVDWNLSGEAAYWLVLPLITLWGAWGLWHIARELRITGDT